MELIDAIKEEYKNNFGEEPNIDDLGTNIFIALHYNSSDIFYAIQRRDTELVTNDISILPEDNENIFNKIIQTNESVAKKLGCSKIITEASYDNDKRSLQSLGYQFEEGKYLGIKEIK